MIKKLKKLLKKILPLPADKLSFVLKTYYTNLLKKADRIFSAVKKLETDLAQSMKDDQIFTAVEKLETTFAQSMKDDQILAAVKKLETTFAQSMKDDQILSAVKKLETDFAHSMADQQKQISDLVAENVRISEELKHIQRQNITLTALLLTRAADPSNQKRSSWILFRERFTDDGHALDFMKPFYDLFDALTETKVMGLMRRDYVNLTLDACLENLRDENDPTAKQLMYDALKNEVFDMLELAGYEESFYENQISYREMCQILDRPYDYNYFAVLSKTFYEQALVKWYREKTGGELNLKDPVTYNDKINWMKINEHDERKIRYADKLGVREFVAKTIGSQYLIPVIGVWDDPECIEFDCLPDQFVLKATHGSGWNIIVPDKSTLNIPEAVKRMKWWLGRKLSYCNGLELHYDGIEPRIIAEQYIENHGGELNDYKVWCFGGKAYYIQYLAERHHGLKMAFYDLDWNKLPFISNHEQLTDTVEKPANLDELVVISERLAAGFNHVRVDFYRLNSGEWKFGEMTFTPGGGRCQWNPIEYNKIMGDLFDLNYHAESEC